MLYLKSKRLYVEIAKPGEAPNDTSRFDRAGAVTEIMLDQTHRFCASEPRNLSHPSTGGRGLMNAYQFDISPDTPEGAVFPRLGVGLLTKPNDRAYNFFDQYQVKQYPIHWSQKEDAVTFVTEPIVCQGYAVHQVKEIRVTDNVLVMTVKLTNVGEKPLHTFEYCHNFLTVDSMALGPTYHLELSECPDQSQLALPETLKKTSEGFIFTKYDEKPVFLVIDDKQAITREAFSWRLTNTGAGAYVEGYAHFRPSRVYLWYVDHMVCMEVYREIQLAPGESHEWIRTWQFGELGT